MGSKQPIVPPRSSYLALFLQFPSIAGEGRNGREGERERERENGRKKEERKTTFDLGAPGWLSQLRVGLLISAQVMISGL